MSSFCKREVDMLRYISRPDLVDLALLAGFPEEAEALLRENTEMPDSRTAAIAQTIRQKIEYLRLFQQGKKIWKKEK